MVSRAVVLGLGVLGFWGCTLDRRGLLTDMLSSGGTGGGGLDARDASADDKARADDARADARAGDDVRADRPLDVPGDGGSLINVATPISAPGGRFTGVTAGASASAGSCGGDAAPEAVYKLELTATSDLFVRTHGTRFDTVVYIRNGGDGAAAEVACNDDADGRDTSVLHANGLPPGTYFIVIDGASGTDSGAFTVDVYANPTSPNAGDTCGRPEHLGSGPYSGNTCGFRDDSDPQPGCTDMPAKSGLDAVFYFVLDAPARVTFDTCANTCFDSVLSVRDVCNAVATELACDDDSCAAGGSCDTSRPQQSRVSQTLAAGVHYLVVDTYPDSPGDPPSCGAFTVTPTGLAP